MAGYSLFEQDAALVEAVRREGVRPAAQRMRRREDGLEQPVGKNP
jgi:hypothetical protein